MNGIRTYTLVMLLVMAATGAGLSAPGLGAAQPSEARLQPVRLLGPIDPDLVPLGARLDEPVRLILELADKPLALLLAESGGNMSDAEQIAYLDELKEKQKDLSRRLGAAGIQVTGNYQKAYNGLAVQMPLRAVAGLSPFYPVVVGVHADREVIFDNSTSVPFIGASQVHNTLDITGKGVKIAIIDTGIDYTHANFGGGRNPPGLR